MTNGDQSDDGWGGAVQALSQLSPFTYTRKTTSESDDAPWSKSSSGSGHISSKNDEQWNTVTRKTRTRRPNPQYKSDGGRRSLRGARGH